MKILNNKKYKFHCYECSSDILFSKEDCLVDRTYGDFWLNCPVCGREYDNQTYKIFRYEYIEEYDEKDKEIERLNNIINELEKDVENRLMLIPDDMCDDALEEIKRTTKIAVYQVVLGKLEELKGSNSNE